MPATVTLRTAPVLSAMLLMLWSVAMCGCTTATGDGGDDSPQTPAQATLVLRASKDVGSASRGSAYEEDIEKMHRLRIIIIDADGTIEINRMLDFGTQPPQDYYGVFKMRPGRDKLIYAIANPESCRLDFDQYPEGSTGALGRALEECVYTFSDSDPIVMTDSRTIPAASLIGGKRTEVTLNLVRVAAKFSVKIVNDRDEDVTLTSFRINGLASKQYLMPHFAGSTEGTANGRHVVNRSGALAFDFTATPGLGTAPPDLTDMHWSDWLKLAIDESWTAPNDTTLADRRGWIMKYLIPDNAGTADGDYMISDSYTQAEVTVARGDSVQLHTRYYAESRSGVLASTDFGRGDADGWEQSYTFDVSFRSGQTPAPDHVKTFTAEPFPNLRALFRSTHVLVTLHLSQEKVSPTVRVVPYVGIELEPAFGWNSLPEGDDKPDPDAGKNK